MSFPCTTVPLPCVAVLGPFGTYSHEAAHRFFGQSTRYEERATIKDVFRALCSSSTDFGVVPQENTIFGSVVETYDLLRDLDGGFIVGEVTLRIDHCLLVKPGVRLENIQTVLSHEQALGQCRLFLETHLPNAITEKTSSTAEAARLLLDRPPTHAAICSRVCATIFKGLVVLREAIQAESDNYTRFYVMAQERGLRHPQKTSEKRRALFRIPIWQSQTLDIGAIMSTITLKIARIDRRPLAGTPFDFVYLIEVGNRVGICETADGEEWRGIVDRTLADLRKKGAVVDLIGVW
ncbi:PDT-domain-containing protein [Coprinopsis marcescibilis]|uniref:prephenate dehydratase n=1 Tax=Coprinopsis marcescibilis TaxID=230819 RepID=A0A5C3LD11_COPMA|nr:PDT-domain-containing protein [Coprinopsis marcescibilis]